MSENVEIKSLKLMQRRRLLGFAIPAFNVPLVVWNIVKTVADFQQGMVFGDQLFIENVVVILSVTFLTLAVPRFFPVYTSKYYHTPEGVMLKRFLRKNKTIPYRDIDRVEVYIRLDEEISEESTKYATDASAVLRKSGFKFQDYTNAERNIVNLFVEKEIYMISPEKPRTLLKELKRRNKKLSAKLVELTKRGKRIQELGK